MADRRLKSNRTQEMPLRKVSLRKVAELDEKVKAGSLIGWECATPEKGQPYMVHLQDGAVFRTSPVQEIEETEMGVVIRTENSIYEARYLRKEHSDEDFSK